MKLRMLLLPAFGVVFTLMLTPAAKSDQRPWKWTVPPTYRVSALSADGKKAILQSSVSSSNPAAVFDRNGTTTYLPDRGYGATANDCNSDGSIVVGVAGVVNGSSYRPIPAIWRNGSLSNLRYPNGDEVTWGVLSNISDDGSTVGGSVEGRGIVSYDLSSFEVLKTLHPFQVWSKVNGISPSGNILVGMTTGPNATEVPVYWMGTTPTPLPPGFIPSDVSDDGLIVGTYLGLGAIYSGGNVSFLPTPSLGPQPLEVHNLSADGRFIIGEGISTSSYYGTYSAACLWELRDGIPVYALNLFGYDPGYMTYGVQWGADVAVPPDSQFPIVAGHHEIIDLTPNVISEDEGNNNFMAIATSQGVVEDPTRNTAHDQISGRMKYWILGNNGEVRNPPDYWLHHPRMRILSVNTWSQVRVGWRYVGLYPAEISCALYIDRRASPFGGRINRSTAKKLGESARYMYPGEWWQTDLRTILERDLSSAEISELTSDSARITMGVELDSQHVVDEVDEEDNLNTEKLLFPFLFIGDRTAWYRSPSQEEINAHFGLNSDGTPKVLKRYSSGTEAYNALISNGVIENEGLRQRLSGGAFVRSYFLNQEIPRDRFDRGFSLRLGSDGYVYITFQDYSYFTGDFHWMEPGVLGAFGRFNPLWWAYVWSFHMMY